MSVDPGVGPRFGAAVMITTDWTPEQKLQYAIECFAHPTRWVLGIDDHDLIEDIVVSGLNAAPKHNRSEDGSPWAVPCTMPPLGVIERAQALADGEVRPSARTQSVAAALGAQDLEWVDVLQFELIKLFHPVYAELDFLTLRIQGICRNCGPVLGWDAELEYPPLVTLPTVATRHHLDIYRRNEGRS